MRCRRGYHTDHIVGWPTPCSFMAPTVDESSQSRRILVWLIVAAASFEFILQASFAFLSGEVVEAVGWTGGAAGIAALAYSIETVKSTGVE